MGYGVIVRSHISGEVIDSTGLIYPERETAVSHARAFNEARGPAFASVVPTPRAGCVRCGQDSPHNKGAICPAKG